MRRGIGWGAWTGLLLYGLLRPLDVGVAEAVVIPWVLALLAGAWVLLR